MECQPLPACVPCPHPPIEPNRSGPDVASIGCWPPEGCCLPSPCAVTEWEFLCSVRSLLPEGDIYNNTRAWAKDPPTNVGVTLIGCARVGCEQLIFGGCCEDRVFCDDEPVAPQLAVVDSFSAVAFQVIRQLCLVLRESDPCTSNLLRRKTAKRMGLITDNPCDPQWSDHVLGLLICILPTLKGRLFNWETLVEVAARFGADIKLRMAGDFSDCAPMGWWTMARDRKDCPPTPYCPPEDRGEGGGVLWPEGPCEGPPRRIPSTYQHRTRKIPMTPECKSLPDSYNLVIAPSDIRIPPNCNLPNTGVTLPHDPELYDAFQWLLPKILPQPVFWCIYHRDETQCII